MEFRKIVEAEMKLKDLRQYAISLFEARKIFSIENMNVEYQEVNELNIINNKDTLEVVVINYFICNVLVNPRELTPYNGTGEGRVSLEFKVPVICKYTYSPKNNATEPHWADSKPIIYRSKAELISVQVDTNIIKLDKGSLTRLTNIFAKTKIKKDVMKNNLSNVFNSTKEKIFLFAEVEKEYKKVKNAYALIQRKQREEEIKSNSLKATEEKKLISSIARYENTTADKIVAYNKGLYVVFNNIGFDYNSVKNIISSFDTEIWAIEGSQKSAIEKNETILKKLSHISPGRLVYITHPTGKDTKVSEDF